MVKVLRSLMRGPLEPYAEGFAEELLRQGYTRSGAEQQPIAVVIANWGDDR